MLFPPLFSPHLAQPLHQLHSYDEHRSSQSWMKCPACSSLIGQRCRLSRAIRHSAKLHANPNLPAPSSPLTPEDTGTTWNHETNELAMGSPQHEGPGTGVPCSWKMAAPWCFGCAHGPLWQRSYALVLWAPQGKKELPEDTRGLCFRTPSSF